MRSSFNELLVPMEQSLLVVLLPTPWLWVSTEILTMFALDASGSFLDPPIVAQSLNRMGTLSRRAFSPERRTTPLAFRFELIFRLW